LIIAAGCAYPREVEEVLHDHPAGAQVAVIGVPHKRARRGGRAAVPLKPGVTATPAELRAFAREQMALYKDQRRVWLVPGLPSGPTGKILRREGQLPEDLR
jgi:long-chain acyl-CoA synthetase